MSVSYKKEVQMEKNEQKNVDELVKTNFFSKKKVETLKSTARYCSCSGCDCPGGEVGPVSASVIGYAGGYAGDLSV